MRGGSELEGYLRHIRACRNFLLPGNRVQFWLGVAQVGWVAPRLADALRALPEITATADGLGLDDLAALPVLKEKMAR